MQLALLVILVLAGAGDGLSPDEHRHLDNLVDQNIVFEYEEINSDGLSGVVDASFIGVKIFHLFDRNCSSKEECGYQEHIVLKSGDVMEELTAPNVLLPYITPAFKLESEVDAQEFEKMLDAVFPVFFSSGKEIYQEGNSWIFVREESFGEKNGIVVVVDAAGVVQNIEAVQNIENGEVGQ
jgi:hypothetical protein